MKTRHYVFIMILLASVLFVEYDLSQRTNVLITAKANNTEQTPQPSQQKIISNQPAPSVAETRGPKLFAERFKKESLQIAKIQNDPDLAQNRMKDLAKDMAPQDVQSLFEIISDDKNDGDQRAMAVELLSLKNDTTSLIALQNFVGNNVNINGSKWDRKKELETILRAQAVESIAAYPQRDIARSTLSYLQQKVDEKFLNDRIGRAAASLKDEAPTIQQQDDAALKKLLE